MTDDSNSLAIRIIARFILLYPAVAAISSLPMNVVTSSNYLMRQWPSGFGNPPTRFTKTCIRFMLSVCPLVGSIYVTNLVSVLTYSGVVSFLVSFFLPALLQIQSKRVCLKRLGYRAGSQDSDLAKRDGETVSLLSGGHVNGSLGIRSAGRCPAMTPYTTVLSHPVVVWSVIVFSVAGAAATVASFALPIREQ